MYLNYVKNQNGKKEVMNWVSTTLKAYLLKNSPSQEEVEHILDWAMSSSGPSKMIRMSYKQAHAKSVLWTKSLQKKGAHIKEIPSDTETIHKFKDGSRIAKLIHERAFQREGFLMCHCAGSYSPKSNMLIYSYRDKKNNPHATFEVSKTGKDINQIKGKGNGPIHPKYIRPILAFLKSINFEVRDSEMKNLGYFYLDSEMKKLVKEFVPKLTEMKLGERMYVYGG